MAPQNGVPYEFTKSMDNHAILRKICVEHNYVLLLKRLSNDAFYNKTVSNAFLGPTQPIQVKVSL